MPLQKQALNLNFAQGLETKADPWQVEPGKMLEMVNTVFNKTGMLTKRNGFEQLATLPGPANHLTTYRGSLIAIKNDLFVLSPTNDQWYNKGECDLVELSTVTLARTAVSITTVDTAVASNLACSAWNDSSGGCYYQISDAITGVTILPPTSLGAANNARVFTIGDFFVVTYITTGAPPSLQYVAIPLTSATSPRPAFTLSTQAASATAAYDGVVVDNTLCLAFNASDAGGAIRVITISSNLIVQTVVPIAGQTCTQISLVADESTAPSRVWMTYQISAGGAIRTTAFSLTTTGINILAGFPVQILASGTTIGALTSIVVNNNLVAYYQVQNFYTGSSGPRSDFVRRITCTPAGVVGTAVTVQRSVGLASKAFILNGEVYFLSVYGGVQGTNNFYQPTYFLIRDLLSVTSGVSGNIMSVLAYANASGYVTTTILPSAQVYDSEVYIGHLRKTLIYPVNKNQNAVGTSNVNVYAQQGIDLAKFIIGEQQVNTAEAGGSLYLTGGMLWMFDGAKPVEHGFAVYPEDITLTQSVTYNFTFSGAPPTVVAGDTYTNNGQTFTVLNSGTGSTALMVGTGAPLASGTLTRATGTGPLTLSYSSFSAAGGSMSLQQYFYQVTYEWTDNAGQLHRSSPSVPQTITVSGSNNSVTLKIPTLRLTYKTDPNPVRIVIYRWSLAQQSYYQVTSITLPIINNPTVDTITYVDTLADASILGNQLIYTTGGVLENTPAPAAYALTLFKSRLFLIDAEDRNLLWYSKPILDSTPVEMTDLQTIYVAPTISSQDSTGDMKALAPMDDKLIIFKANAIYYLVGNGPDATGLNNDYGDPGFITATVGSTRPNSLVNTPNGIMFQSDKGIWLLGRDLTTTYIGAPVEAYNSSEVLAASIIPGTNQVRFTLDTGQTLVYDYFFNQWSTFEGIPGLSSVVYQDKHTYIDRFNRTFKEKSDFYLDGSVPVTIRFKSAWFKMAGLQGFQRAYYFMLLGKYLSPHKLTLSIAYDYNINPSQITNITPENFSGYWGDIALWGNEGPWGGKTQVEQWRIFMNQQKCQSFQITLQEFYDPLVGPAAGAGLTLSGINLIVGVKKGWNTLAPRLSTT